MRVVAVEWLADELRAAGLTVTETVGWKGRGRPYPFQPIGVMVHHTATRLDADDPVPSLEVCRLGRSSVKGPLCQLLLGRDGVFYVVAAGYANHAGLGGPYGRIAKNMANRYLVGLEVEHCGTDGEPWNPMLLSLAAKATAVINKRLGGSYAIAHKEWAPNRKVDPWKWDMAAWRCQVQGFLSPPKPEPKPKTVTVWVGATLYAIATLAGISVPALLKANPQITDPGKIKPGVVVTLPPDSKTVTPPSPRPTPSKPSAKPRPRPVLHLGSRGKYVAEVQRKLHIRSDGIFGKRTRKAVATFQRHHRLRADGIVGSRTWEVLLR